MSHPADADFRPASGLLAQLDLLRIEIAGPVLHVRLNRPAKRNAISDTLITQLHTCFVNLPEGVRAAIVSGEGDHFCAGLDLSRTGRARRPERVLHSRMWHAAFEAIQFGKVPVVAVLHGAVVGGGLELAAACHIRVAEASTYYGLPEGQRGLFVGGGGSVRMPRLIGVARMTDMMLTGRVYDVNEGVRPGLSQYWWPPAPALPRRWRWREAHGQQRADVNFAVMHALPRIADQARPRACSPNR
jgi:enoyl-CoA hydratase/carnithine racemase